MRRTPPTTNSDEIQLYMRTYYSLLRSSTPIRIKSLEDTHKGTNSSLHIHAETDIIDVSAFLYSALRLPNCVHSVKLVLMAQSDSVFEKKGYRDISTWHKVKAPARRRRMHFNPKESLLAAYIASVTDIDDIIPCLVAYQIEWNKIHAKLLTNNLLNKYESPLNEEQIINIKQELKQALDLTEDDINKITSIWNTDDIVNIFKKISNHFLDISVILLGSGFSDYRKSVQKWWHHIETTVKNLDLQNRPVYFVSSNTHSIVNLVSGICYDWREQIDKIMREKNYEDLREEFIKCSNDKENFSAKYRNIIYYCSRWLNNSDHKNYYFSYIKNREKELGIIKITTPHYIDVESQVFDIGLLKKEYLDPRANSINDADWDLLKNSNALILNIDYPLGMAAYHLLSQTTASLNNIVGMYILGKAATLNGRIGDVMIPNIVHDEHSKNTYLLRNVFSANDLSPWLIYGTVFDNQKSVTVKGTFLQNHQFMKIFYKEGYTDIEMETGPYLSAVYEHNFPNRYPHNEIVNLFINVPYEIGLIHYASDTPISRRQNLLSKSLSYFGVDSTYGATIAILRTLLQTEIKRLKQLSKEEINE